jgi:hypothetical protein
MGALEWICLITGLPTALAVVIGAITWLVKVIGRIAAIEATIKSMNQNIERLLNREDARNCQQHAARLTEIERRLGVLERGPSRHDTHHADND